MTVTAPSLTTYREGDSERTPLTLNATPMIENPEELIQGINKGSQRIMTHCKWCNCILFTVVFFLGISITASKKNTVGAEITGYAIIGIIALNIIQNLHACYSIREGRNMIHKIKSRVRQGHNV